MAICYRENDDHHEILDVLPCLYISHIKWDFNSCELIPAPACIEREPGSWKKTKKEELGFIL